MALSKATSHAHNTSVTPVIQPDEVEEIEMGINAAAMKLIIDRLTDLYPHPIDSSVREVISNAIDATAKLPEDERKPVEILSPTALNASFRVIDHGIGMSPDDVRKIYSQYGGSTKTDDFTQLGAYGLGAKAPLAYCSEFQVTTSKDGITTIFTCSRKAMGNVTTIVSSKHTGRENGTEVVIPVKTQDLGDFRHSINKFKQFAPDVPLNIDTEHVVTEDCYQLFDNFMLDDETGTVGRVWINNEEARTYFENLVRPSRYYNSNFTVRYVLSGWMYSIGDSGGDPTFIVELKPGVVDFSSSRDSITRNERSNALHGRVVEYYSVLNETLLEKVMTYYRELPTKSAWNFIADLQLTQEGKNVKLSTSTKSFSLPITDFTLNQGGNPVAELVASSAANTFGVLDLTTEAHDYKFMVGSLNSTAIRVELKNAGGRVGDITASMQDAVKKKEKTAFLYNAIATRTRHGYYNHTAQNRELVVVTGVDEDFAEIIRKNRPLLTKDIFPNKLMALTTSVTKAELTLAKNALETEIVKYTTDEVWDLILEARQERRKNVVAKEVDTEVSVVVFDATNATNVKELKDALRRNRSSGSKRISEIINDGDFIIVGDSVENVLKGAMNTGANVYGHKIYVLNVPQNLRAGHFDLMLGYRDVYVAPDFKARCKAAVQLAELQTRDARLFKEEIEELTEGQVMRCVGAATALPQEVWEELRIASFGTPYEEAFAAYTKTDHKRGDYYLYTPSLDELLVDNFGQDTAEKIKLISNVVNNLSEDAGLEGAMFFALRDRYGYYHARKPLTDRGKTMLRFVAPLFVEYLGEVADKLQETAENTAAN